MKFKYCRHSNEFNIMSKGSKPSFKRSKSVAIKIWIVFCTMWKVMIIPRGDEGGGGGGVGGVDGWQRRGAFGSVPKPFHGIKLVWQRPFISPKK